MTTHTTPTNTFPREQAAGLVDSDMALREAPGPQPAWYFDIRDLVLRSYRNPRAAIVTVAAAGLVLGFLLKKCLPARRRVASEYIK